MKLGRFLTTLGIGALVGMLLAPKKGSELREELKGKGKETLDSAKEMTVEDYQKLISETIDSIKKTVDEFDVDDFKDSSLAKLNELKDKFDDVVTKLQDSDQYSKLKDQVDNVIVLKDCIHVLDGYRVRYTVIRRHNGFLGIYFRF